MSLSKTTETKANAKNKTPAHKIAPRCNFVRPMTTTLTAATKIPTWSRSIEWAEEMIQNAIHGEKASINLMVSTG